MYLITYHDRAGYTHSRVVDLAELQKLTSEQLIIVKDCWVLK